MYDNEKSALSYDPRFIGQRRAPKAPETAASPCNCKGPNVCVQTSPL